jgi:tetratricopeptide (TPR) repeat protein
MGFWKSFFGGEPDSPEEEKKNAEAKNFDLLKYDGVKAMRIHQMDYAVRCFREALKIQDDPETHDYLQRALVANGQLDEALTELKTLLRLSPTNTQVLLQAAHVAYMLEDYTQMTELCQQAIDTEPDNAMAHYMMAQASLGQGDSVSAIAQLTKTIALNEQLGDARLLRAQTLMRMGELAGAREDVDWLLEHTDDHEDVMMMNARLTAAEGKTDEAILIYNNVEELNPFQLDALRERGRLKMEKGDKDGAEQDMRKLLELNPGELEGATGEYQAEGVEKMMKRAYSPINPFGI